LADEVIEISRADVRFWHKADVRHADFVVMHNAARSMVEYDTLIKGQS